MNNITEYLQSIAGGMPFSQIVQPGMSFSPEFPMGQMPQGFEAPTLSGLLDVGPLPINEGFRFGSSGYSTGFGGGLLGSQNPVDDTPIFYDTESMNPLGRLVPPSKFVKPSLPSLELFNLSPGLLGQNYL